MRCTQMLDVVRRVIHDHQPDDLEIVFVTFENGRFVTHRVDAAWIIFLDATPDSQTAVAFFDPESAKSARLDKEETKQ